MEELSELDATRMVTFYLWKRIIQFNRISTGKPW